MTARSRRTDPPTPRALSNWSIAAGALVLLAAAAVVWFVLLRRYGGQGPQVQLDAIRTAGTLVVGTGGAVALLLTARRQRYTELTLVHTTSDATERRITELYTKAADQLGSDKAPVRLAWRASHIPDSGPNKVRPGMEGMNARTAQKIHS